MKMTPVLICQYKTLFASCHMCHQYGHNTIVCYLLEPSEDLNKKYDNFLNFLTNFPTDIGPI